MKYVSFLLFSAIGLFPLVIYVSAADTNNDLTYGAESNPTGDPIGGGTGYRNIVEKGDFSVTTAGELLSALKKAKSGQTVYVVHDAGIDLTDRIPKLGIRIENGVTLAGNRGKGGAKGPLIFTTKMQDRKQAFFMPRGNTRITGLRIRGPDGPMTDATFKDGKKSGPDTRSWSDAIRIFPDCDNVEVDNCEVYEFSHTSVSPAGRGTKIHHCFIHDIHIYPISHVGGDVLIEANIISGFWHIIASTGQPGSSYELRYNVLVRPTPEKWPWLNKNGHVIDVHAYKPLMPRQKIAGEKFSIHHNTVPNGPDIFGVRIRGVPGDIAEIYNNWFSEKDPARGMEQDWPSRKEKLARGNFWAYNNAYGPDKKVVPVEPGATPRIRFKQPPPPAEQPFPVSGKLPIDIEVSAFNGRQLASVLVQLDQKQLYSGSQAPKKDSIVVDAGSMEKGEHKLTVMAVDSVNATAEYSIYLNIGVQDKR